MNSSAKHFFFSSSICLGLSTHHIISTLFFTLLYFMLWWHCMVFHLIRMTKTKKKGMSTLRRLAQSLLQAHGRTRKKKYLTRIRFEFWHFFFFGRILNRNPFQQFLLVCRFFFVLWFLNKHQESNAKQSKKCELFKMNNSVGSIMPFQNVPTQRYLVIYFLNRNCIYFCMLKQNFDAYFFNSYLKTTIRRHFGRRNIVWWPNKNRWCEQNVDK